MKRRSITSLQDADALVAAVKRSANQALQQIVHMSTGPDALQTLWSMKFRPIGCDPLDSEVPLNLIEQINQTFTYIASARAVRLLFELKPEFAPFALNLGTASGSDIESNRSGGLACEVFAAVNTSNNKKLAKDVSKVAKTSARHKYVFFMCPGYETGRQVKLETTPGIEVWSVGGEA